MRNVKIHGGNITVTSGDEGTTFIITLPIQDHTGKEEMI